MCVLRTTIADFIAIVQAQILFKDLREQTQTSVEKAGSSSEIMAARNGNI